MSIENETLYKLGQIEGKLDSLIELVGQHVKDDKDTFDTLGKRLTGLEAARNRIIGAAAVITVGVNAVWAFLTRG